MTTNKKNMFVNIQTELNNRISDVWIHSNYNWTLAIRLELAEALESTDWKWWKSQETDFENIKVELIDIFHFMISLGISKQYAMNQLDGALDYVSKPVSSSNIINVLSGFFQQTTGISESESAFDIFLDSLLFLMRRLEIDIEKVYRAKAALNVFRQDNGYDEGEYLKIWDGEEDNYYMMKFAEETETDDNFEVVLYNKLYMKYKKAEKQ